VQGVVDYAGCVKVSTETPNTSNNTKFDTQDHFDINQDDSGVKKAFGSPCPQGTGMVTKKEGGFLGIGAKTVEVGCMTPYQYEMLNQMDRMNRPVVVPPVNTRKSCRSQVVGNQVFTNCW
jgi:hypothetical protein